MKDKFTIIVDSREQTPFRFDDWPVEVAGLVTGDYSIKGLEDLVSIERKSVDDLCGCVTNNRERFKKELHRLQSYRCRAIIVEAEMGWIYDGNYHSKVKPQCVIGSICSWQIKYNVPFVFAGPFGAKFSLSLMRNFWIQCEMFVKVFQQ